MTDIKLELDPHALDVMIRVRVKSKPGATEAPHLEVIARDAAAVQVMGVAFIDDTAFDAAWGRFCRRAIFWNPVRPPRDFIKFDLFGESAKCMAVLEEARDPAKSEDMRTSVSAVLHGGITGAEIQAELDARARRRG